LYEKERKKERKKERQINDLYQIIIGKWKMSYMVSI
jgi:hypothetical protein